MSSLSSQSAAQTIAAKPAALPPVAPAPPGASSGPFSGVLRPYANERLNSRLPLPLPPGHWASAWQVPLNPTLQPAHLLLAGAHALALGQFEAQLFAQRQPVAHFVTAGADAELLPSAALLLLPDRYSRIITYALASGTPGASLSPSGPFETRRTFVHRHGAHTIVAGLDKASSPHNPVPKRISYLEVFDAAGQLTASRDANFGPLCVAQHNDFLVLARPGAVDFLDLSLDVQRRISAPILPLGLSVDEASRLYGLAEVQGRQQLWIMTPSGDYAAVPLPEGVAGYHRPPIVGYDHRAYILSPNRIVSISPAAELDWQWSAPARVAGAMVLADGHLLAAAGDSVYALNGKGEARLLAQLPGELLVASPVLSATGELCVLSSTRLHGLSIRQG
jgi:hypothetical protein